MLTNDSAAVQAACGGSLVELRNSRPHDKQPSKLVFLGKLSKARKILQNNGLSKHRTCNCCHVPTDSHVELSRMVDQRGRGRDYTMNGVQTCGSVWACPRCAQKVGVARAEEFEHAARAWLEEGGQLVLLTLTMQHKRGETLAEVTDRLQAASVKFWAQRAVKNIKEDIGLLGRVSGTEGTHGQANGWHPHYHIALFTRNIPKNKSELDILTKELRGQWLHAVHRSGGFANERGLDLKVFSDANDHDQAKAFSEYVNKMSLTYEILGQHKDGKQQSRTNWQLMNDAIAGDEYATKLYVEWVKVMQGKRQHRWSKGLKEYFGLKDRTDDQISEKDEIEKGEENSEKQQFLLKSEAFRYIAKKRLVPELCETWLHNGQTGVTAFLKKNVPTIKYEYTKEEQETVPIWWEIKQKRKACGELRRQKLAMKWIKSFSPNSKYGYRARRVFDQIHAKVQEMINKDDLSNDQIIKELNNHTAKYYMEFLATLKHVHTQMPIYKDTLKLIQSYQRDRSNDFYNYGLNKNKVKFLGKFSDNRLKIDD